MVLRFVLVALLLCLPLRLWAGVGLMSLEQAHKMDVSAQHTVHEAAASHPCHAVAEADARPAPVQPRTHDVSHCGSGDCHICTACHMPAMQGAVFLEFHLAAPQAWVAHSGLTPRSEPLHSLFKPPVS
jgi:hypothetical protein